MTLYQNDFYMTLRSEIERPKRPFTSIFRCKYKKPKVNQFLIEGENEKRYHMGKYGPLVVEHISELQKNALYRTNNKKNKKRCKSKNYKSPFIYFNKHSNCKETKLCWHDIQSPQILRHYSPPRSSNINDTYYGW